MCALARLKTVKFLIGLLGFLILIQCQNSNPGGDSQTEEYVGSGDCIQCHERFYKLWAPSHHGLAMQNISPEFIQKEVRATTEDVKVDSSLFSVVLTKDSMFFVEKKGTEEIRFPTLFALGGKNVYFFMTQFDKGRLQVLPLAYDVNRDEWYNNPESAIRHFMDGAGEDEALPWKHSAFTFNTSCWGCHVSQLENNYDVASNSYHTTWRENGINCETCHGPSSEHVRVCLEAGKGNVPEDLKIISTRVFSHEQHNASCGPCHAKMSPITPSFLPGERFFDHYNLTTLEHRDFYPDGRDLGENYTMTTWHQSGCLKGGEFDCMHCHTSSGRYRFKGEKTNQACMPCHEENVNNVAAHSHHPQGSEGAKCVSCHMPMTEFARMRRSDHSMRPPMPLATKAFGSPNACNICHTEHDADWSQKYLVKWGKDHHQKPVLEQGRLIEQARSNQWENLDEMLKFLDEQVFDEVFSNSMIRLLATCDSEKKWPSIIKALDHSSPLVRSSAAAGLIRQTTPEAIDGLLKATMDDYRLVRIEAAFALASLPEQFLQGKDLTTYNSALQEYITSRTSRPDDWGSHGSLGNFFMNRQEYHKAIEHFGISTLLNPDNVAGFVNRGLTYSFIGDLKSAETELDKALKVDPNNEATNLNLALLKGEMGDREEAELAYRKVLELNETSAVAAFNLSVLVSQRDVKEAVRFAKIAFDNDKATPKYGYTYGFFLNQEGKTVKAISILNSLIKSNPDYTDSYFLLFDIYSKNNRMAEAKKMMQKGIQNAAIPQQVRMQMQQMLSRQ